MSSPTTDLQFPEGAALKLGKVEAQVFTAWEGTDPDYAYPFATISRRSGVDHRQIRRAVRSLARKGLVTFHRGLFTDEGYTAGSGYGLTEAGYRAISALDAAGGSNGE